MYRDLFDLIDFEEIDKWNSKEKRGRKKNCLSI